MRLTSAFVAVALTLATGSLARAIDIESRSEGLDARQICTQQCVQEKPQCPEGQMASGSEGCWSACCVPARANLPFKQPIRLPEDQAGDKIVRACHDEQNGEAELGEDC
ncbi:hypothetical protein P168DRAFT_307583 [Aspergillus campestris IBT 28561]|uniref:Uncharacterized protein n=1 Tax=Aspergillus campestris (strain IBT 28561) TaxID=1392248 RepID=A0A2I1CRK2_ASPC2|nr:uncharacterized protein P168DRAFT_307583 [Aspergillus campestris IBT 28561]PKY00247.1 hypothetical protein P168DRAFT_307583 [Aspergillus campestris IBT 28561]